MQEILHEGLNRLSKLCLDMRVFITGISGFLGRHLARQLESYGHKVLGVDINPKTIAELRRTNPLIPVLEGSICDEDTLKEIRYRLLRHKITHVVHAAANKYIEKNEENPLEAVDVNVTGSANIAKICQELNIPVLGISTDKAENPSSLYGYTKLLMEEMFAVMGYACYRGVNFFGSDGSVIPIWYAQAMASKPLTVRNLECIRYFTPVSQVVAEIISLLQDEDLKPSIYLPNLAHSLSLHDLLDAFMSFYDYSEFVVGKTLSYEKIREEISVRIQEVPGTVEIVHEWLSNMETFDLLQNKD
jgi:FlaA1/EpsC-like NDP-sugar epimerase